MNGDRVKGLIHTLLSLAERSARFESPGEVVYEYQISHAAGQTPGIQAALYIHRANTRASWISRMTITAPGVEYVHMVSGVSITASLQDLEGHFNTWARTIFGRR